MSALHYIFLPKFKKKFYTNVYITSYKGGSDEPLGGYKYGDTQQKGTTAAVSVTACVMLVWMIDASDCEMHSVRKLCVFCVFYQQLLHEVATLTILRSKANMLFF